MKEKNCQQHSVVLDDETWRKLGIIANGRCPKSSPNRVMQHYIAIGIEQEFPEVVRHISSWSSNNKKEVVTNEIEN
jgi:hypothetical protein